MMSVKTCNIKTSRHDFNSHVGIGSNSQDFFGDSKIICSTSLEKQEYNQSDDFLVVQVPELDHQGLCISVYCRGFVATMSVLKESMSIERYFLNETVLLIGAGFAAL